MITKQIAWDADKNRIVKQQRGISFEDVIACIAGERLLDVVAHPDQKKYPRQKMLIVAFQGYAYIVPFVEDDKILFLKTIIPSRKATKQYLHR